MLTDITKGWELSISFYKLWCFYRTDVDVISSIIASFRLTNITVQDHINVFTLSMYWEISLCQSSKTLLIAGIYIFIIVFGSSAIVSYTLDHAMISNLSFNWDFTYSSMSICISIVTLSYRKYVCFFLNII